METTIAIESRILPLLHDLKKEMKVRSLSDVVEKLAIEKKKIPESMYGAFKKNPIPQITREDKRGFFP